MELAHVGAGLKKYRLALMLQNHCISSYSKQVATSRVIRKLFWVIIFPAFLLPIWAQDSQPLPDVKHGTLNLVIANSNGFVIAADSRRTTLDRTHWDDDSQKLFRVGEKSALAISGFATCSVSHTPVDIEVAGRIREDLEDPYWFGKKRRIEGLAGFLSTTIGSDLSLVGGVYGLSSIPDLEFKAIGVELDKGGRTNIVTFRFIPRLKIVGPFDTIVPQFDLYTEHRTVQQFSFETAGIDSVARKILDGDYASNDFRIQNYYAARSRHRLDDLSITELTLLASAILEETKRRTNLVGGPDQIGAFPRKGSPVWSLPPLTSTKQRIPSTVLYAGYNYVPGGWISKEGWVGLGKESYVDTLVNMTLPLDTPYRQVYLGSRFRGVTVSLDGNVFAGSRFEDVAFQYSGGDFWLYNSSIDGCSLFIPPGMQVPSQLQICSLNREKRPPIIGERIHARAKGCVHFNKFGRLVVQSKGRYKGKDCRGSALTLPVIGPPQPK